MAQERYPVTSNDEGNTQTENLEIGKLNFPDLTSSELDSVTDAEAGDTYFDTDRNQLVRFTGPSSYVPITSYTEVIKDETPSSDLTLGTTDLEHCPIFEQSSDPSSPSSFLFFYDSKNFASSASSVFFYFVSEQFPTGWYDNDNKGAGTQENAIFSFNEYVTIRTPSLNSFIDTKWGLSNRNQDIFFHFYRWMDNSNDSNNSLNILSKSVSKDTKYKGKYTISLLNNEPENTHNLNFNTDVNVSGYFKSRRFFDGLNEYSPKFRDDNLGSHYPIDSDSGAQSIAKTTFPNDPAFAAISTFEFEFEFVPEADGTFSFTAHRGSSTNNYKSFLSQGILELTTLV